jgi:hypothetical protein
MTTFETRETAFENKFAHDQQLQFRAEARACKMFGAWLAAEMGLTGDDIAHYANDLVVANLDEPGLDDVLDKAEDDLKIKGKFIIRDDLRHKLDGFYADAKRQIMKETA